MGTLMLTAMRVRTDFANFVSPCVHLFRCVLRACTCLVHVLYLASSEQVPPSSSIERSVAKNDVVGSNELGLQGKARNVTCYYS
jgi:hypothetical protein